MKYRKLRIAFSITCAIACVLLVVLWVRSYRHKDQFMPFGWTCHSIQGTLMTFCRKIDDSLEIHTYESLSVKSHWERPVNLAPVEGMIGFYIMWYGWTPWYVQIPYWFPVSTLAAFGTILLSVKSLRFSLRTLLIATTLVAVGLGAIVYAAR